MKYFRIKMVSAMEKVFADKEPSGEGNLARLTALKGETVSGCLLLGGKWKRERKGGSDISN